MDLNDKNVEVQNYYGKELQTSNDLKTNACCTIKIYPSKIKKALSNIHDEVLSKYYGCGLTIPKKLDGMRILDLGSGSGRDCYLAAQLVGEKGEVVGVDMTDEQLKVANDHIDYHTEKFGYKKSNVSFIKANIEQLDQIGLAPNSFDIIISNCVINLVKDKEKVLKDCFSLLKEGGEMYFSDVYSSKRIPEHLIDDPVLYGECLSGALYWNDFLGLSKVAGFIDPRPVESAPITINNSELQLKCEGIKFFSVTYRLFKIGGLEHDCEDYGQAVIYNGGIDESNNSYLLDNHHVFEKGKIEKVCGNSFLMLQKTRLKDHFTFLGDFKTHYGIYEGCGGSMPFNDNTAEDQGAAPCC